jgi:hemolysin activation/secretion protein
VARLAAVSLLIGVLLVAAGAAGAAQRDRRLRTYVVTEFTISYALEHPEHPPIDELLTLPVQLTPTRGGYRAPRPGELTSTVILGSPPRDYTRYFASALQHINRAIVAEFGRRGIGGVLVALPDIEEGSGVDLRPRGQTKLRIKIWTGRVESVTTFADGDRFGGLPDDQRTNHAAHAWILERSPLQPGGSGELLRTQELEDFAFRASRHPGRQVEAQLSPGARPGATRVDYRVAENKPWFAYAQYSNTGTDQTTLSRERFGFVHHQLTRRDDILGLDYVTGDFDSVHAVFGSYDTPLLSRGLLGNRLRGQLAGSWSEYDASEVGVSLTSFTGEQWEIGAQLLYNVFQHRDLFVDVFAGLRWQSVRVDNQTLGEKGDDDFLLPRIGVLARRDTDTSSSSLRMYLEHNLASLANTEGGSGNSAPLGRLDTDPKFTVLHWNGSLSFYLEPLLDRVAWEDPRSPRSSTLAHEVALVFKGQWSFGDRLIPQHEQVAGGFYTVRGYEQAIIAGDSGLIGSAEYRFHLPRVLYPNPRPLLMPLLGEFRDRAQYVYGRPDWDLILRLFLDAGHVRPSDPVGAEEKATLMSIGGGVELQLLRNLNLRFDIGLALGDAGGRVKKWSTEYHLLASLLY